MPDMISKIPGETKKTEDLLENKTQPAKSPMLETPLLEDVSEQVMAQPYIRFT
ncbi:MAG: hypothetical protein POG74_01650 [Acidocella sp.]|nr:hypothetical protein [Acidocella sp.]